MERRCSRPIPSSPSAARRSRVRLGALAPARGRPSCSRTRTGRMASTALLPSVASRERLGRVSGLGWAVGYLGSVVALIFAHVVLGETARPCSSSLAVALFALPLFLLVETARRSGTRESALAGLRAALRDAWRTRDLRRFLAAFFLYNDGVTTTIAFAALFAKDELGFPQALLVGLIVGIQVTGAIGAALLGGVADRRGNVFAIGGTLVLWLAVTLAAFGLSLDLALWEGREQARQLAFLGVGLAVGFGLGAVQSQSRASSSGWCRSRARPSSWDSTRSAAARAPSWGPPCLARSRRSPAQRARRCSSSLRSSQVASCCSAASTSSGPPRASARPKRLAEGGVSRTSRRRCAPSRASAGRCLCAASAPRARCACFVFRPRRSKTG